ncbi:MAG: TrkH family potassium uptake protein [Actinobacteria bacterium]|nr:MAG: TrkH family potassium uptake protein [Actinomycetota bacterium]
MWVDRTRADVRAIAHYIGVLVVGIGLLMLLPLLTAVVLGEWAVAVDYLAGLGVSLAAGVLLMLAAPPGTRLSHSNALLVTGLAWLAATLVAAVPLAFSGNYASFLDAAFDAMSGLTTSGLTLAQDLDHMSLAHNMWRHLTHLIGGQGIVVAALSLAIGLRGGAISLYQAEGREERIMPNVMHSARFIWFVTAVWVTLGTLAISALNMVRGMSLVRGSLHAFFAAVATFDTGGFGPMSQNALYYHSPVFEFITLVLMLAGTLNFNLHADLWRGDLREIWSNIEARTLAINMGLLSLAVAIGLTATRLFGSPGEVIRKGVYHIVSANTGTGHQTLYAPQWGTDVGGLAFAAVVLAMAFGGMASSTAGGIKALRVGVIVKGIIQRVRVSLAPPSAVIRTRYHHITDQTLTDELLSGALLVFVLYVVTYISGGLIGAAYGYPAAQAIFESVSATANVGLSTGITSPAMPVGLKLVYMVQMWAGRLEFIALFAVFASAGLAFRRRKARGL